MQFFSEFTKNLPPIPFTKPFYHKPTIPLRQTFENHRKSTRLSHSIEFVYPYKSLQARIQKFFKGGEGVEEENFERKMFVGICINACTHKN